MLTKPINSSLPIEAYLVPVVAKRKPLPRGKHAEINARVAARAMMSAKRKLTAVSSKAPTSRGAAPAGGDTSQYPQAFDREGYAAFLRQWAEELDAIGEIERDKLEERLKPFFAGAVMGKQWRDIISALRGIRDANARSETMPHVSHADGRSVSRGW